MLGGITQKTHDYLDSDDSHFVQSGPQLENQLSRNKKFSRTN